MLASDKEGIEPSGGDEFVAFFSAELDEGAKAGSLGEVRARGLNKRDLVGDAEIIFDEDETGATTQRLPKIPVVAVNIDTEETEVVRVSLLIEKCVEGVRAGALDEATEATHGWLIDITFREDSVAFGVALDLDAAPTGEYEFAGVAAVKAIPSADVDARVAEGGTEDFGDFREQAIFAGLGVDVAGVLVEPT